MFRRSATRRVVIGHAPGLHARPCLAIVQTVRRFHSKVQVRFGKQVADASEVLELMSLGAPTGAEVTLSAEGPDADDVLDALVKLVAEDFGMS